MSSPPLLGKRKNKSSIAKKNRISNNEQGISNEGVLLLDTPFKAA
jgi:hypothetical protein